ncbi:SRPBCC domain-containing protein [Leifsonia sp. NPDC058292]|uniref:SRPBCC domain-containing protein n=1 Tax=Leifsonia sp. NPDC058292 TaxID=3346428 RepID=UPI0036DA45EC
MSMTDYQASVVDEKTFVVTRSIHIAAPVEKVWRAITEPAQISRWFGRAEFDGSGAGANGTLTWPDRRPVPVRIEAIDEPRTVSYRWSNDDASGSEPSEVDDATSTVFTFSLEPLDDGTRLTVVETGFDVTSDPAANLESHRQGWNAELDKLVALLEGDA